MADVDENNLPQFRSEMQATTPPALPRAKRSTGTLRESRPRKREKYARVACTLCKVRKVKCSGNQPCSRCEELQSDCIYNDAPFHSEAHIISPQSTQLDLELSVSRVNKTCDHIQQLIGSFVDSQRSRVCLQRTRSRANENVQSKVHMPTDFRYTLDHTRHLLKVRGSPTPPDFNNLNYPLLAGDQNISPDALITLLQAARPVLQLGYQKINQLHTLFKQEIYPLHPCIRLQLSQDIIDTVFSLLARGPFNATYDLEVIDLEIMKAVVAVALLVEGDTQLPLAFDLESHLLWSVDSCYDQEHPQIEDIIMATLLSLYLELKHRPIKAWRMSGVAAKLCLELGIHQEDYFDGARDHPDRMIDCKRLFACVYDVDRRCSFYSGLPWTFHDRDIDMTALRLEPKESYLSTMISLDRNLSETWTIINSSSRSPSKESRERVEFLNFQLQKLVSNMPTDDFAPLEPTVESPEWLRLGLKLFCRLRVHHIKMLSHVGSFDSMRDLISQPQSARALVTSAAEAVEMTLEMISNGAKTSPLLLPSALKFLLSSLSFMLLVVSHYSTQYRALCSKPFYAAIDILNKMQDVVKDPSLNIRGTLQEMRKIAGVIQLSPPPLDQSTVPFSFIDAKQGVDGTANTEQTFATPNMFDELQTPNSDFFSNLGDVNISGADSLYMNMSNMFD